MVHKTVVFNNNDKMKKNCYNFEMVCCGEKTLYLFYFSVQIDALFVVVALSVVLVADIKTSQSTTKYLLMPKHI
jgi:hypothetical protein